MSGTCRFVRCALVGLIALVLTAGSPLFGSSVGYLATSGTTAYASSTKCGDPSRPEHQTRYLASQPIPYSGARTDLYVCNSQMYGNQFRFIVTIWGRHLSRPHISLTVWVCGDLKKGGVFQADDWTYTSPRFMYQHDAFTCGAQVVNSGTKVTTAGGGSVESARGGPFYLHV